MAEESTVTEIDARTRRMRSHQFAGAAALVVAVGAFPLLGWIAALSMALIGVGNLLAARGVKNDGEVAPVAWAVMLLGVLGFLTICVLLAVGAFRS